MLSDLRRRKFTNYFSILDRSGNGKLGDADLERIVEGVNLRPGLARQRGSTPRWRPR